MNFLGSAKGVIVISERTGQAPWQYKSATLDWSRWGGSSGSEGTGKLLLQVVGPDGSIHQELKLDKTDLEAFWRHLRKGGAKVRKRPEDGVEG